MNIKRAVYLVASAVLLAVLGVAIVAGASGGDEPAASQENASTGETASPTELPRTVRMVNDVDIPICQDIGFSGKEPTHSVPPGPPLLPRNGKPGNVYCGALPTEVTRTPKLGPTTQSR